MKMKREYLIVLLIQVTEILGYSLILPFLPFYVLEFGVSEIMVGLLLTTFSLFQFVSAPILGRLSDFYGRKNLLILSQLSTMVSFMVLALSHSLWMVFLSRIIDGALGSNMTIAQAYLSDVSTKKERSKVFALTGIAFGFGFLIGPAIGGTLAKVSYSLPAWLAAGLSGLTIVITALLMKETIKNKPEVDLKIKIFDWEIFTKYISDKKIGSYLKQFFFFILAHMTWVSMWAVFGKSRFGFDSAQVGYVLAYIGLISIVLRGGLIPKLIDIFGEKKLLFSGMLAIIVGMLLVSWVSEVWIFYLLVGLFAYGSGVIRPLLMGSISQLSSDKEQGAVLGLANGLGSIAQIGGPMIGGVLLAHFASYSLPVVVALIMAIGLGLFIKQTKLKLGYEKNKG